jgi:uncharacterized protein (TIGR03382 family)
VTFIINRLGGAEGAVSVDYATVSGTATADTDFASANGTLTWADGEDGPLEIEIAITDDAAEEGAETFALELSNATGGATIADDQTTVTIAANDDDAGGGGGGGGGGRGGGGSTGTAPLLALFGLALLGRRRTPAVQGAQPG